jgi:endonuclease-3
MPASRESKSKAAKKKSVRPVPKGAVIAASSRRQNDSIRAERVQIILHRLAEHYPNAVCALRHRNAWELLVATILSAQCTDVRVNMVTPELFRRFPTPQTMANASPAELEELIRSTGFFRNKAKNLIGAARQLVETFGGTVPKTMDQILTLPGVARKTGNVVLGSWYKIAVGVVVDTHVMRISQRLELTKSTLPEKIEQDLMQIVPAQQWIDFSHRLIQFGREICIARKPRCADCFLEDICNSKDKTWSTHSRMSRSSVSPT